jgi:spore photoproduct lyase
MDIAKAFRPETILLWEKAADDPEAQRIISLLPSANVQMVKHQRLPASQHVSMAQAIRKGKRTLMIGHATSFVGRFDGGLGSSIRCCPYHKLVPLSNGCPYRCTYCYLAFVYRKHAPFIKLNTNYDAMFKQIRRAISLSSGRVNFNMGEMLDSLALDHITNLTAMLVPFFAGFSKAYLMLLTKSSNIDNLLAIEPNDHTVVSWSLNSQNAVDIYEIGTATLAQRIEAARKCQDHGYRIRFRIDPGILHDNWQSAYADMIASALKVAEPENITLGMLRLITGHDKLAAQIYGQRAADLSRQELTEKCSDGKSRYPPDKRIQFYKFLINTIRYLNKHVSISLCRETPEIWQALHNHCAPNNCNCITW